MTVTNAQGSINPGTNGQYRGKAPLATLFSLDLNNSDETLQAAAALTNALISNNSWDYADSTYDLAAASYDAAVRDSLPGVTGSQPVLFVFSAGNSGDGDDSGGGGNADSILSPATAKDVITVGALEQQRNITNIVTDADGNSNAVWQPQTDTSFEVASYSSRGNVGIGTEGPNGRFKPDVVAPGSFVVSTRSSQWDEQAYYNPTNFSFNTFTNQTVTTNVLNQYSLSVPGNAVGVMVVIVPNIFSSTFFPTNLPVYVEIAHRPTTNTFDFVTFKNGFSIPPDSGGTITGIQSLTNGGFFFAVGNTNISPVNYDLITEVITTNDLGNQLEVLSNLNDSIGTLDSQGKYPYRYESGTSMAAADTSGVLALMQDFFTNTLHATPSPALMKAMLINGARTTGSYNFNIATPAINFEGWGLINLPNSLAAGITNQMGASCSSLFLDQSPTNALATGDSQTFFVKINSASLAQDLPLAVTLAWTDPPGNPAAAIKLVNNLDVVVTNLDDPANPVVYFGNDIATNSQFNLPWNTNTTPNLDSINNVENIIIPNPLGTNYSVTVIGRSVNVNAVTAQTNNSSGNFAPNVVQDYALVIACGEGEVTNALTVTPSAIVSNLTSDQQITSVAATNTPLFNQFAGASTPLLGTNKVDLGGTNEMVTLGMTNQWHFYVVTNNALDGSGSGVDVTNAAFITFLPDTLAIPRMGVFAGSAANATQPEADIDMYVSTDPTLTNLNPVVISNCVNGTQIGASVANDFNGASLSRGGTEFVVDTNSTSGQIYYVGVKSETAEAAEYAFIPVFSATPFSQMNANGDETVFGVPLPVNIPDGTPAHPGTGYVFALALQPVEVGNVIVTNTITHQNFGDLIGVLSFNGISTVLNNHDGLGPVINLPLIYDDGGTGGSVIGSQPADGPGSLNSFIGQQGVGPWILTETDDALTAVGSVTGFNMFLQKHQDLSKGLINISVQPGTFFTDFIDVPVGVTSLTVSATNLPPTITPPLELFVKLGSAPTLADTNDMVLLTNSSPVGPWNFITTGPPLQPGRYFVSIFNPSFTTANFSIIATLGTFATGAVATVNFASGGSVPILDDAVTTSSLFVTNTDTIQSLNIGLRVDHPRISDLVFHLISPDGTRYLLMENRGGTSTNGAGVTILSTNDIANFSNTGTTNASTNFVFVSQPSGTLPISWNFFSIPDQMTVYDSTNNFTSGNLIFDTGMVSGTGQTNLPFTTAVGALTVIINQFGNTNANGDEWTYTAGGVSTNYFYLIFTEDTNLATIPIKFAPPPFVPAASFTTNAIPTAPADVPLLAGPILSPINGHYYYLLQTNNWTASESWAEELGGHLATIRNDAENLWVLNTFSPQPTAPQGFYGLWIGLHDPNNDTSTVPAIHGTNFVWASGETGTYRNWQAGEPNNGGTFTTGEYWTYIFSEDQAANGIWNDFKNQSFDTGDHFNSGVAEVIPTVVTTSSNLYYLPEQDLSPLNGTSAFGTWQLEIQDDRVGAGLTNSLLSWQLQFIFANTNFVPSVPVNTLTNGMPQTNVVPANSISWFLVNVPVNADIATNDLIFATAPVNLLFNSTVPDTNGDVTLLPNATSGISILTTSSAPTNIVPGSFYYLGVQNTNNFAVTNALEVDFHLIAASSPFAFTQPAQAVTGTNAQLNGMATPNGLPATAWFEWGTNTSYGNQTPPASVGNSMNVVYVTNSISLTPNVPYHFRLVVSNAFAVVRGFDQILDEANVVVWGANFAGQLAAPAGLSNVVAIAGAYDHSLALKNDETAVIWGDDTFGQTNIPAGLNNNLLAVAGGESYSLALKNTGTVITWGANIFPGETNVPAGLNNVVMIASGQYSSLALQSNGTVVAWGANISGLTNVPASLSNNAVAIAGGSFHNLAIKNDGTVVAWGDDSIGQTNVPATLTNVVAIAAGSFHSLALKSDGTVVAWGDDSAGQMDVPTNLTGVAAIAAGGFHSLALKSDGSIVSWGDDSAGQRDVPLGLTNFVAIAAGNLHSLALTPQFVASLTNIVSDLPGGTPQTNNISPGGINYFRISVPPNADFATNILLFAQNGPLNVWFTTNSPPSIATNATLLFVGSTNGSTFSVLSTNSSPTNITPNMIYYLGVQNTNSVPVNYAIEVDFHLLTAPPVVISSITATNIGGTNGFLLQWFAPTNDIFEVQIATNLASPVWQTIATNIIYTGGPTVTNGLFTFFDDGSQVPFGPVRFYRLILSGSGTTTPNTPPSFLATPPNQIINPLNPLIVTNTATDAQSPPQILTYTLTSTATGANQPIINNTGIITWTPDVSQAGTSNVITTIVSDNGSPSLSATNSFVVIVTPVPQISSIVISNGFYLLTWLAPTNDIFEVQVATNLASPVWQTLATNIMYTGPVTPTNGVFSYLDDGTQVPFGPLRFYRLILTGVTAPPSPPPPVIPISNIIITNGDFLLTWLAPTNDIFQVQVATNLASPVWQTIATNIMYTGPVTPTNGVFSYLDDGTQVPFGSLRFYRLILTGVSAPASPAVSISSIIITNGNFLLTWSAPTNDQFNVRWTTNIVPPQNWTLFSNNIMPSVVTSTNGTFTFLDTNAPVLMKFYDLILLP